MVWLPMRQTIGHCTAFIKINLVHFSLKIQNVNKKWNWEKCGTKLPVGGFDRQDEYNIDPLHNGNVIKLLPVIIIKLMLSSISMMNIPI